MKKFNCDVCRQEVDENWKLSKLRETLCIENISDICDDCEKELNDISGRMEKAIYEIKEHWLKKALRKMINRSIE